MVPTINAMLGEFCFKHGTPLVQFAYAIGGAASGVAIYQVLADAPRLATDSWDNWYRRCLTHPPSPPDPPSLPES